MVSDKRRFDENNEAILLRREREVRWDPPRFLSRFDLQPGQTVLDLGCGAGFWTFSLAEAVGPRGAVWALDISEKMLSTLVGRNPPPHIRTVLSDLPEIRLPDGAVDFVWSAFVFHEITDAGSLAAEIKRVLKPGGAVAVLDWRTDAFGNSGPPRHHRLTPSQVCRYLEHAGFNDAVQIWQDSDNYLINAT